MQVIRWQKYIKSVFKGFLKGYKICWSTLHSQQVFYLAYRNPCGEKCNVALSGYFISYFLEFNLTSWRKEKQVHIVDLHHISIFIESFRKNFKTFAALQTISFPFSYFLANLPQTLEAVWCSNKEHGIWSQH